jgi:predicted nuclease of predicted toxin-antitoxin system
LLDAGLSPRLAVDLRGRGFDVIHVRDIGLQTALDDEILQRAADEGRVLIALDGDFSALLAHGNLACPSLIHLRSRGLSDPARQAEAIDGAIALAKDELVRGAIVTIRDNQVRIRALPVH